MTDADIAIIKTAIRDELQPFSDKIEEMNKIITGNGEPERGMCFRLAKVESGLKELIKEKIIGRLEKVEAFIGSLRAAPKISWLLISQIVTWGILLYSIVRK